jgi:hypothetical protein
VAALGVSGSGLHPQLRPCWPLTAKIRYVCCSGETSDQTKSRGHLQEGASGPRPGRLPLPSFPDGPPDPLTLFDGTAHLPLLRRMRQWKKAPPSEALAMNESEDHPRGRRGKAHLQNKLLKLLPISAHILSWGEEGGWNRTCGRGGCLLCAP